MGKECLKIFLNLKRSPEQQNDLNECIQGLEAYFKPKRNVFNMYTQNPKDPVDRDVNWLQKAALTY